MFLLNKQTIYLNFFKKKNILFKKNLKSKLILLKKKVFIRIKPNVIKPYFSYHYIPLGVNKFTVHLFIRNINTHKFDSRGKTLKNNFFSKK